MIIIRYLAREMLRSQFFVLLVLVLVFLGQKFVGVLSEVSDGGIPAKIVFSAIGLNMPKMVLLILPLSLYMAILITLGRFHSDSEITAMYALGLGSELLVRAALYVSLITVGIAAINAFWLLPWSQEKEAHLMEDMASKRGVELLKKGSFESTPDGTSVFFVGDIKGKKMYDIFLAQIRVRKNALPSIVVCASGEIKALSDGRTILRLWQGSHYEVTPARLDYRVTSFEKYESVIEPRRKRVVVQSWEAIPTLDLARNSQVGAKAELQWRISAVLCIPLFALLAIPLASLKPRQGRFSKVVPALSIYLIYFMLISAAKSGISRGSIPATVGLWPVVVVLMIVALILNNMDITRLSLRKRSKR